MPTITNLNQVKRELHGRATKIQTAIQNGSLNTKEDAQQLLRESKQPLQMGKPVAITVFNSGVTQAAYNSLNRELKKLQSLIPSLPTKVAFAKEQQELDTSAKLEESIKEKISQFIKDVAEIDDSNEFKGAAQGLEETMNDIIKRYCEDNKLTKDTLPAMVSEIAKSIENAEPKFEAKSWHFVADLALTLLNGLKSVVRGVGLKNQPFKLFSEQGQEIKAVNSVMEQLKESVAKEQPAVDISL